MSLHTTQPAPRISVASIREARSRIDPEFLNSRFAEHDVLSTAVGARLLCKIEAENAVRSFKGRGAQSFINALARCPAGVMTASAGNFGLALTYAAHKRNIATTVYAAETANPAKLDLMRSAGAIVEVFGQDLDEAKKEARDVAGKGNIPFVEDGREPEISAGAGTMAMEITAWPQFINSILVPLGNGALLAGIGCWFRAYSPMTQIVGVCAEGAPSMALSWRSGRLQTTEAVNTIADGIAVRVPVPEALDDIRGVIDDVVLVSEDALKHAVELLRGSLALVCEPAGAAGVAALLSHSRLSKGLVCTPITGANIRT